MSNMTFGVNLIPSQDNTYSLGNSTNKWNVYADTINGVDPANMGLPSGGTAGQVLMKDSATDGDASWTDEVMVVNITYSNNAYSSDYTYAQIKAAVDANKIVVAYMYYEYYTLYKASFSTVEFRSVNDGGSIIIIDSNNLVQMKATTVARKSVIPITFSNGVCSFSGTPKYSRFSDFHNDISSGYIIFLKNSYSDSSQVYGYSSSRVDYYIYTGTYKLKVNNANKAGYQFIGTCDNVLRVITISNQTGSVPTAAYFADATITYQDFPLELPIAIAQGGTGATDANTALANLTSVFPYNGDWKTAPIGLSLWYYDTTSASTYDVPSGASFVVVIRHTYANAIAMCFKYTSNPQYMGWNRMNGNTWSGWDHLVLTGSLSNNNGTYINTVSGSWERHDKVVTFTCQFTMKTAITTSLSTAISGLPASTKMSTFLVNANSAYTADTQRTVSAYNGYLYLGGPFSTGITYTVSGSYVI